MTLEERIKQLEKVQARFPGELREAAKGATLRAIEKAAEMTPPTEGDDISGTHTLTSGMKQHWESDSVSTPAQQGESLVTVLANNKKYASYVNDGHRMDRHFVPGLYIDKASGHLAYDPEMAAARTGGLMVGTQTTYVEGIGMVDAAKEEYRRVLRSEVNKLMERMK